MQRTLLDVLLQITQAGLEELLLVRRNLANVVDLLCAVRAELDLGGEEVDALVLVQRAVDEGGLDNALLALGGLEQRLGEASTGHGHGEGSGASAVLGLDNLVTAELDAVHELVAGGAVEVGMVRLGEERDDGDAGVAANNGDELVGGVGLLDLGDEARSADNVEGGDTEDALGVVDTLGLVDLGDDGDSRVDLGRQHCSGLQGRDTNRVGDDEDVGVGGSIGSGLGEVADNGGVGVEEVYPISIMPRRISLEPYRHGSCQACEGHQPG
jgi:hypothetical protein